MSEVRVPELRFPEFEGEWKARPFANLLERASEPVEVHSDETYREIGVRSHGRGLFHKEPTTGTEIGNKRVFHVVPDALVLNIVFAWEQAVALTSQNEVGFIASHRFPMFLEKDGQSYLPFIQRLLLTQKGKALLEIASPGGAGRNKTLGQDAFLKLKAMVPERKEQQKIAAFLDGVSRKIALLGEKRAGLMAYKRGVMQRLFSGTLRFTRPDGSAFPDWEERKLGEVFSERKQRSNSQAELLSVTMDKGVVRASDIGREDGASADTGNYKLVAVGDIAYNSMRMWQGASGLSAYEGIVSPAYTVITPKELQCPLFWGYRFKDSVLIFQFRRYSQGLTSDTWNLKYPALSAIKVWVPHPEEQTKIAEALSALDAKIDAVSAQISQMEAFKKGLLQKMFV